MPKILKATFWILIPALLVAGFNWHLQSVGRLEGEIKARGESIKQLAELAAKKQHAYQKAKAIYLKAPTLASCSVVLLTCEERHETDSTQIALLTKQVGTYKKIQRSRKLFGFLPRPHVQVGYCVAADGKAQPCLSGGFNIF